MKPETELIRNFYVELMAVVANHAGTITSDCHWTRIESNLTNQGIPDVNICYKGAEFWIEFKVWPNELEPLQVSWIKRRRLAGGLVFIVTKTSTLNMANYKVNDCSKFVDDVVYGSIKGAVDFILDKVKEHNNA